MISRAAQARKVCLRCQLRLLAGPRPHVQSRFQAQPVRIASTRQLRLYSSENPWERLESANDVAKKIHKVPRPEPTDDSLEWLDQIEPSGPEVYLDTDIDPRQREPRRRTARGASANYRPREIDGYDQGREQLQGEKKEKIHHGRIGSRRVTLQPEDLDIEILGQRAHTIVMRDNLASKPRRTIQEAAAEEGLPEEEVEAAMRARMDALHDKASPEEALANIEELRPQTQLLSDHEFWSLHEVLTEGFTSAQVSHYIRANRKAGQTTKGSLSPADLRQPRPWMARPYNLRPIQDLQLPPNSSVKSRAVFTLMRTTWMLDLWGRVEALNEVDIIFKDPAAATALHTGHEGRDRIARLRRELLQSGETLTFGDSSAQLRIVARRATAEAIIDTLEGLVNAISTETFVLCPPQSATTEAGMVFRDTLLNELGRVTKTTPVLEDSGLVRVKWIKSQNDMELNGRDLEHMGHILWRLLYTAHIQPPATAALAQDFVSAGGVLNPVANAQDRWAWKNRLGDWSRWILPVTRDTDALISTQALVDRLPQMIESTTTEEPTSDASTLIWGTPEQTVSTTFGHVLFDYGNGTLDMKNLQAQEGGVSTLSPAADGQDSQRIFSAVVPRPGGLSVLNSLAPAAPASTTMVFRFAAGPATGGAKYLLDPAEGAKQVDSTSAPQSFLEIYVAVPDELPVDGRLTWDASPVKRIRAISNTSLIDVPLPDRPVDMRLSSSTISTLSDVDAVPALRAFIDASHLDLASGNLRTPPRLFIPEDEAAPFSALTSGATVQSGRPGRKAKAADDVFEHRKGFRTFEFIGLEVRRAVELDYEGHKLAYTSVEAGLHGGRRAELSLEMGPSTEAATEGEHRAKYVDLARRLADGELVTWAEGGLAEQALWAERQEAEAKKAEAKEAQAREAQAQEAQAQEAQAQEAQAHEAQAHETQAHEAQVDEVEVNEAKAEELQEEPKHEEEQTNEGEQKLTDDKPESETKEEETPRPEA